jgi:hypothetical protein
MPRDLGGASAGTLRVKYPTLNFEQTIEFVSRKRNFGGKQFYFQCPATGRLASVLWKPPGATRFCSRRAWRNVAYRSQFADATNRCLLAKDNIRTKLGAGWFDDMPPRPKRMREATYARWEARYEKHERKLDAMLLRLFQTKWLHLKDIV